MKYLLIYSHPNPLSFCNAIVNTVREELWEKKHELIIRDLYGIGFDPVLKASDFIARQAGQTPADIKIEQDYVVWSDVMIFIYPIWWAALPAMIKGYIDRVISYGFAYKRDAGGNVIPLLTGKKVIVFNTQGAPEERYEKSGMFEAMRKTSDFAIFEFCGMQVLAHQFFGAVTTVDEATRKLYLKKVDTTMNQLPAGQG
ncbi:MAG: General stress protein 14 [Smithella sp. PtaU1.Bin162]|nr:MAG: General stress protein 14 [Smithella sp. PtaU1.Bin162]